MNKLLLIAGPCAIEDESTCEDIADTVQYICSQLDIKYIFKGSYKKANRTKLDSFTTIGETEALEIIKSISDVGIETITDVHESHECEWVSKYVDYLQIPAFLCRQTELLIAAAKHSKKGVNIKKGQFMAPNAMKFQVDKVFISVLHRLGLDPLNEEGREEIKKDANIWITERGTTFGYNNLVVDMTSIPKMKKFAPVIMDCTHSVQIPNQTEGVTGGDASMIETMALSAIAAGADGLFIETHPDPSQASSDAASILQLDKLKPILEKCVKVRNALL